MAQAGLDVGRVTNPGVAGGAAQLRRLSEMGVGERGIVREHRLEAEDAALLRAMGLSVGVTLRVFRLGEPTVVAVGGVTGHCKCGGLCRIGVARRLAEKILVEDVRTVVVVPVSAG